MLRLKDAGRQLRLWSGGRRLYSSQSLRVGDGVSGFRVDRVVEVPKLDMTAVELSHAGTGARHLHVNRKDTNNVFAIGFKTLPPDHSGLPHILEHTTLCGSNKFPVRDPFFKMLTRSLANYMNALTGVDYTFYPFATTNGKDFANLQQVYLDSVYDPLLRELDFRQEGWRLEHDVPEDKESPLMFKGVVYNEMKGQLSNPAYLFYIRFFQAIYPSLQFSGGDPAHMTALEYKDLVNFHNTRYHPSNSFSFSYGSLPLTEALDPVAKAIEKRAEKSGLEGAVNSGKESIPQRPEPISLDKNTEIEVEGPIDPTVDPNKQYKVSLSWIVGDSNDLKSTIAWKVLGTLLTDGHASPFYKALIDSGIGTDFSVNTGLEETPAKNIFTIGLQGLTKEAVPQFEKAVANVFADIAENGIPKERLEAVLNQAELADREVDAGFGMDLVSRLFPRVFNDPRNYLDLLDNEKILSSFRTQYNENPALFQDLVKSKLVSGPFLKFSMVPSATFDQNLVEQEKKQLQDKIDSLTEEDRVQIFNSGLDLLENQKAQEDISSLPSLATEDISLQATKIDVKKIDDAVVDSVQNPVRIFTRETGTQGLTYLHLFKNISNKVPKELYPYLSLFSSAMNNVGTSDYSMSELENIIRLNTGGVSSSLMIRTAPQALQAKKLDDLQLLLTLGGSSLDEKSSYLYDILLQILVKADFTNIEKLRPLIQSSAANALNSLSDSGHRFAMGHARSGMSAKSYLEEQLSGMEQIKFIIKLSKLDDKALLETVVPKLQQIQAIVAQSSGLEAGLTFTPSQTTLNNNISHLTNFVKTLSKAKSNDSSSVLTGLENRSTHLKTQFQLPFQVSYVGAAIQGASYFDQDSAALQILSNLLTHRYLHTEIREKGGAYGGGASYSAMDGVLAFYSYRDPNPLNTIETIGNTGRWAVAKEWTERDLREAKLSIFQGIDAPISPRSEISYELYYGLTNEMRQARREALLGVSVKDISAVAEKYLLNTVDNLGSDKASLTVLGPSRSEFTEEQGWNVVDPESN
ncbi:Cym1p [Sugiyamaella lignohabitans]|uniref:Presequence protease, mitochondrial n=1 Tax=Sugiyamaella lignohabitans TaxID=796027 RepID=A0A167CXC2_9ASCO|nr:Cym1p [Sugiyamaella lignohabitans]ANB12221.1 Cym1p [Sugiyamaella lignohabitans]